MVPAVWALIGVVLAGLITFVVDARGGRRGLSSELRGLSSELRGLSSELRLEFRTELRDVREEMRADFHELRTGDEAIRQELRQGDQAIWEELRRIAETQAEMSGQLAVLRAMAHTHDAA